MPFGGQGSMILNKCLDALISIWFLSPLWEFSPRAADYERASEQYPVPAVAMAVIKKRRAKERGSGTLENIATSIVPQEHLSLNILSIYGGTISTYEQRITNCKIPQTDLRPCNKRNNLIYKLDFLFIVPNIIYTNMKKCKRTGFIQWLGTYSLLVIQIDFYLGSTLELNSVVLDQYGVFF